MDIYRSWKMFGKVIRARNADQVVLATSFALREKLYGEIEKIRKMSPAVLEIVLIPDGEKAKEWNSLGRILTQFTMMCLTKKSLVIALGGGSVSDVVGLACSMYKRGMAHINIPTTLLAQVDASIGGKTAINFLGHKNQLGTFHQPIAIFAIAEFLRKLNKEQFIDGLAEIIKAGFIKDHEIFDILVRYKISELRKKPVILKKLIMKATAVKEYFVDKDPKDNGPRMALNLGHTLGHALELKYGLSHGMAVLVGMFMEFKFADKLFLERPRKWVPLQMILSRLGIVINPEKYKIDKKSILHDKKVYGGKISMPVIDIFDDVKIIDLSIKDLIDSTKKLN